MNTNLSNFIVFFSLSILYGCTTPYHPALIEPAESFTGIEQALNASRPQPVSLVIIHGMCHHDEGWFDEALVSFADAFGMQRAPSSDNAPWISETPSGVVAYRSELSRGADRLIIYGIVYSQATLAAKQKWLCPDVSKQTAVCNGEPTYTKNRASINASIKNTLLNDCLADAVLYIGPRGDSVRVGVRKVLADIFKDIEYQAEGKPSWLVFYAESLGSKVLTDALLCATDAELRTNLITLRRLGSVFLAANQIPILNLAYQAPDCEMQAAQSLLNKDIGDPDTRSGWGLLLELIDKERASPGIRAFSIAPDRPVDVIAFTDPNDLLSYQLTPELIGNKHRVFNIAVSNMPTFLGKLEDPVKAHTTYIENKDVQLLIRSGNQH